MRYLTLGEKGRERPFVLLDDGEVVAFDDVLKAQAPSCISRALHLLPQVVDSISRSCKGKRPIQEGERIGPPIVSPRQIFSTGANYDSHVRQAEGVYDRTNLPSAVIFMKPLDALAGPFDPIICPPQVKCLDYEAEIAVIIGKETSYVTPEQAPDHIAGYALCNDVSSRDAFFKALEDPKAPDPHLDILRAKGWRGFLPLGPYLVTTDEIDAATMTMQLRVNGEVRQEGSSAQMRATPAELVSQLSMITTLYPGDILTTGSPAGVGAAMKPPRLLEDGDEIAITGGRLGTMTTRVRKSHVPQAHR